MTVPIATLALLIVALGGALKLEHYGSWKSSFLRFLAPIIPLVVARALLSGITDPDELAITVALSLAAVLVCSLGRPTRLLPDGWLPPGDDGELEFRRSIRVRAARLLGVLALLGISAMVVVVWNTA